MGTYSVVCSLLFYSPLFLFFSLFFLYDHLFLRYEDGSHGEQRLTWPWWHPRGTRPRRRPSLRRTTDEVVARLHCHCRQGKGHEDGRNIKRLASVHHAIVCQKYKTSNYTGTSTACVESAVCGLYADKDKNKAHTFFHQALVNPCIG